MLDDFNDISFEIGNLGKVKRFKEKFGDYELIEYNPNNTNDTPYLNYYLKGAVSIKRCGVAIDNSNLMLSLINLGKIFYEKKAYVAHINYCKNMLNCVDDVIAWCKKYGIPNENRYFRENWVHPDCTKCDTGYSAFNLWHFIRQVTRLYLAYALWNAIEREHIDDIMKFYRIGAIVTVEVNNSNVKDYLPRIKDDIAVSILPYVMSVSGYIEYFEGSDSFNVTPFSNDLVNIAFYQFSLLIAGNGVNIKECSECHNLFEYKKENGWGYRCSSLCKSEYQAKARMKSYYNK